MSGDNPSTSFHPKNMMPTVKHVGWQHPVRIEFLRITCRPVHRWLRECDTAPIPQTYVEYPVTVYIMIT
jgi:hypothetical protein